MVADPTASRNAYNSNRAVSGHKMRVQPRKGVQRSISISMEGVGYPWPEEQRKAVQQPDPKGSARHVGHGGGR